MSMRRKVALVGIGLFITALVIVVGVTGHAKGGTSASHDTVAPLTPVVPVTPLTSVVPAVSPATPARNDATCITTPMSVPEETWEWAQQQAVGTATQDVIAQRLQVMDLSAQADGYARTHAIGRIAVPCWLVDEVETRLHGASAVVSPVTVTRWLEAALVASVPAAPPAAQLAAPAVASAPLSKAAVTAAIKAGGWPDALIKHALCITWHESSWIPTAHDTDDPGQGSYGLFQIEAWWASTAVAVSFGPRFDLTQAFDPDYNASFAYRIYQSEGWHVWSTAHFCTA